MKLVEIEKIVLQPNVTSLVIDNIFSADYDDYVIMVDYGMGNVPNNRPRFLDVNGNEDSGTEYQLHQIRANNTGQLFQRSDTNSMSDMFWKYTGNHQIAWLYRPFSASHPSTALVWGVQSAGASYTEHAHNHDRQQSNRGIKFIIYNGSVYYNTGTIKIYGVAE
tara:strand:+ start:969 stop:1460 length:492 start_codon:yes stop_codon:yes gene_type:complete